MCYASGDLNFSNDSDVLFGWVLATNIASLVAFLVETFVYFKRPAVLKGWAKVTLLYCFHLGVEDVFQMTLYAIAGASKTASGIGQGWSWMLAVLQCTAFVIARAVDAAGICDRR